MVLPAKLCGSEDSEASAFSWGCTEITLYFHGGYSLCTSRSLGEVEQDDSRSEAHVHICDIRNIDTQFFSDK